MTMLAVVALAIACSDPAVVVGAGVGVGSVSGFVPGGRADVDVEFPVSDAFRVHVGVDGACGLGGCYLYRVGGAVGVVAHRVVGDVDLVGGVVVVGGYGVVFVTDNLPPPAVDVGAGVLGSARWIVSDVVELRLNVGVAPGAGVLLGRTDPFLSVVPQLGVGVGFRL